MPNDPKSYQIGFRNVTDDQDIVQECEQDVKEAARMTGVTRYQATCLVSPDQSGSSAIDGEADDVGSSLDLDELDW